MIILLLSIFALQFAAAKDVNLKGKVITVDSGHGDSCCPNVKGNKYNIYKVKGTFD